MILRARELWPVCCVCERGRDSERERDVNNEFVGASSCVCHIHIIMSSWGRVRGSKYRKEFGGFHNGPRKSVFLRVPHTLEEYAGGNSWEEM